MRIIRKIPGLGRNEPLVMPIIRPKTRREFLAQGFMTGGLRAAAFGIQLDGESAHRAASRRWFRHGGRGRRVRITAGAGMIPFICSICRAGHMSARTYSAWSGRPARFPERRRLQQLDSGSMVPNSSTKSFIASLGLRYHSDSAQLRGSRRASQRRRAAR